MCAGLGKIRTPCEFQRQAQKTLNAAERRRTRPNGTPARTGALEKEERAGEATASRGRPLSKLVRWERRRRFTRAPSAAFSGVQRFLRLLLALPHHSAYRGPP